MPSHKRWARRVYASRFRCSRKLLHAPWGNLAIFCRNGVESEGLMLLGRMVSGVQAFQGPDPLDVTITLAHPPQA